jgi:hypothetical protein
MVAMQPEMERSIIFVVPACLILSKSALSSAVE